MSQKLKIIKLPLSQKIKIMYKFVSIIYPKNVFSTLESCKYNVWKMLCEDYFDTMVNNVFLFSNGIS